MKPYDCDLVDKPVRYAASSVCDASPTSEKPWRLQGEDSRARPGRGGVRITSERLEI